MANIMGIAWIALSVSAAQNPIDIPSLHWTERSDWTNVRHDVSPAAVGDGVADDTAAIQAALDVEGVRKAVYLPPGVYRITDTLVLRGPTEGALVVGHGRDTTIVWDGPEDGRMFHSDGAAYSRFIGLAWDGRGIASVGFDHASTARFETEVRHQYEAFRNMRDFGIRVGNEQVMASAEILYLDCIFERCGTGLGLLTFNDYDNTIDGCEFRDCGAGIRDTHANFYVRNSRFEGSTEADIVMGSEHGSSIRRCTSLGSRRFVTMNSGIAPLTIQDCRVSGWTDPEGAVHLSGSPVLMMDCVFEDPPSDAPPVVRASEQQRVIVGGCSPARLDELLRPAGGPWVYEVPGGQRPGIAEEATREFPRGPVLTEGRVFDAVRDFGAAGDGSADDTDAIQAAIDAARAAGGDAVAYLPAGRYVISRTLSVTGEHYALEGGGFRCGLVWAGPPGQPMVAVDGAQGVRLASLAVGHGDWGTMDHGDDVLITSRDGRPSQVTLDEVYGYGLYRNDPDRHGIHLRDLPLGSVIHGVHVQGNVRVAGCSDATVVLRTSYEGTLTVEGGRPPGARGILGVLMRLGTLCRPTLHVKDNQSIVMTDFYNEQTDQHLLIEGRPGQAPGRVTIQGAKMHLNTEEPAVEIRDYEGLVYYGQSQFYIDPRAPRFVSTGERPVELVLAGHFWYNTTPQLELAPATRVVLLGNRGVPDDAVPDAGVDAALLGRLSAVLDDLRQLGEADLLTRRMGAGAL